VITGGTACSVDVGNLDEDDVSGDSSIYNRMSIVIGSLASK
jgi:hypothetical protein